MIYIISDIHGSLRRYRNLMRKATTISGKSPGRGDIVLVLGDLFAASGSASPEELAKREMQLFGYIEHQEYDLVSVRGNHDRPKRLHSWHAYPDVKYGNDVVSICENISFLTDGKIYDIPCGKEKTIKVLAIGGALTHALRFKHKKDLPTVARYRVIYKKLIYATKMIDVDYVVAHDCPSRKMGILGFVFGKNELNRLLDTIDDNVKQKRWFYGHHHTDSDSESKYHCIFRRVIYIDSNGIDSISKNMLENDKKRIAKNEKIHEKKHEALSEINKLKESAANLARKPRDFRKNKKSNKN